MLLLSYAEDEMDVEGTVTGVTRPAKGNSTHTCHTHKDNIKGKQSLTSDFISFSCFAKCVFIQVVLRPDRPPSQGRAERKSQRKRKGDFSPN